MIHVRDLIGTMSSWELEKHREIAGKPMENDSVRFTM